MGSNRLLENYNCILIMISEKGTVGLTLSASDMPFSKEGISPDLIINPQASPSEIRSCGLVINCKSYNKLYCMGNIVKLRESRQQIINTAY